MTDLYQPSFLLSPSPQDKFDSASLRRLWINIVRDGNLFQFLLMFPIELQDEVILRM